MDGIYEYSLFALICVTLLQEVLRPLEPAAALWQLEPEPLNEHYTWLAHLSQAREAETLGPLRLENRFGSLCVVGLGECRPVPSAEQGLQLIETLKEQIAAVFSDAP